jgi:hypothetical protein
MRNAIASALAAVFAITALGPAAAGNTELANDADIGKARMGLYYNPFVGPVRARGVKRITIPQPGVYCIKTKKKIDMRSIIPSVTVDRTYSTGADALAHWAGSAVNCPNFKRWIEVRTYRFSGGSVVAAGTVGFALVVP